MASLLAALTLVGCAQEPQAASPPPSLMPVALFSSDEEAAAAATEAYAAYLRTADQIANEGGQNPGRMDQFAAGGALRNDMAAFQQFRDHGARSVGSTRTKTVKLQSIRDGGGYTEVTIYVCEDISSVDVLDSSGASIVSPDRQNGLAYATTISFHSRADYKVTARDIIEGRGTC